ncbi:uncharacterized protein LOC126901929 isoform X2 [Daktulosphaira vitifoliae]|uniref:uncharacterized protein LOC126901929 isoform X2 n=1 Tax=Daktulosphaira vitifoliae TaxID=58002 RepID=UPI0021AAA285|nr:uncharacterized protein LOC126901929 isoform X2 [Daktulosphaira vitifoliae]
MVTGCLSEIMLCFLLKLSIIATCMVNYTSSAECGPNQNGQPTSFYKTAGDILLTGFYDVYDEKCTGPLATGIHSMEMVATVVQVLNSVHYVPGMTIGLSLYEVCSHRSSDLQKAMISFVVDQDCDNSTTPIAIYTTNDVCSKLSIDSPLSLNVPIIGMGSIINIEMLSESAVKFLIENNVSVVDLLVAQNKEAAQMFEIIAKNNALCLNKTVLVQETVRWNDSMVVVMLLTKEDFTRTLQSFNEVQVSHFIVIPVDGPLSPESDIINGSYVFQSYGNCPLSNKSGLNMSASGSNELGIERISLQFVQTAVDVMAIVDEYRRFVEGIAECGKNNETSLQCGSEVTGNWTAGTKMVPVNFDADAISEALNKLMLLDDGDYNVTLVHVVEYGTGETVSEYVQDSNGTRSFQYREDRVYFNRCETDCPICTDTVRFDRQQWLLTWKEDVWIASTLTVSAVGAICAVCISAFILIRVCKKDILEGNPTFTFILMVGTFLMYASAVPFAVETTTYANVMCYAKLFGTCASFSIVFSAMLARCIMIAACDCDSSFMSHVNGYLQTSLCTFTVCVQLALLLQFMAIHAVVPDSDLCHVFIDGNLFLGSLSYDILLLMLLGCTTPFVFKSKRNYREGACFAVATFLTFIVWLCWCTAYAQLPKKWSDLCVMIGLSGTATVMVITVFVPRTYMMMFGIVREQITSSLPSLGYGHTNVADVNYRSNQALYDSVHVAPAKCTSFRGQTNPNYYSPAGSQVHSSRPATPSAVNEYDIPPSPDNRITRF